MSDGQLFKPPTENFSVLIAGGGISGLTAAHELAERGFKVYLVEKDLGLYKSGDPKKPRLQLGGMARTQYSVGGKENKLPLPEGEEADKERPVLPGEHGFRFFPSYYSHVWNTMQRIPIYEKHKGERRATHRTVYDNLEPCRTVATGAQGTVPYIMDRAKPTSAAEFIDRMRILFEAGYEPMDLDIYLTRLMRYMCTCSDRRAATCEDISFYDYLVGRDPGSKVDRYHYTQEFLDSIQSMPKVLAAFDAVWGDARTNWSTMVQLIANEVQDQPKVDAVLNGPTTEVWIEPWRKHLEELGVEFLNGEIDHFELDDGKPKPVFKGEIKDRKGASLSHEDLQALLEALHNVNYTVVALDAPGAQAVTGKLPPVGVAGQLKDFVWEIAEPLRGKDKGKGPAITRDPYTESGKQPWDRFQTLTGIQYFFDRYIRVVHGHIYMPGTKYALSSIFEQDFWQRRPNLKKDKYLTLLSVDIGAWRTRSSYTDKSANESTRDELALEVWRQSHEALGTTNNVEIPDPLWYHMDTNIEYDQNTELPVRNKTPYLIPIVGEYPQRPDAEPWNPAGPKAQLEPAKENLWQAGHGGYLVHWDSMVFAGTYKKTFTRMTTMESACESGRHAVNAILDHCNHRLYNDRRDRPGQHWKVPTGFRTERHLSPVYEPTPLSDYCQIYDMEDNELPNLAFAKQIDQWFFDHNLPHPWEVLGLDAFVSYVSFVGSKFPLPKTGSDFSELLGKLISGSISPGLAPGVDLPKIDTYLPSLLDAMRQLRELLEKLVSAQGEDQPEKND